LNAGQYLAPQLTVRFHTDINSNQFSAIVISFNRISASFPPYKQFCYKFTAAAYIVVQKISFLFFEYIAQNKPI